MKGDISDLSDESEGSKLSEKPGLLEPKPKPMLQRLQTQIIPKKEAHSKLQMDTEVFINNMVEIKGMRIMNILLEMSIEPPETNTAKTSPSKLGVKVVYDNSKFKSNINNYKNKIQPKWISKLIDCSNVYRKLDIAKVLRRRGVTSR